MKKVISLCAVALMMFGNAQAMNLESQKEELPKLDCERLVTAYYQDQMANNYDASTDEINQASNDLWDDCDAYNAAH